MRDGVLEHHQVVKHEVDFETHRRLDRHSMQAYEGFEDNAVVGD